MRPDPRLTTFVLTAALLAGCGSSAPSPTKNAASAPATGLTAQAAAKDAAARKLIDTYKALKGQTAAVLKQRLAVIDKLGETDSDRAAEFLAIELDRVDAEPEAAQDKLVPAIVSALSELDEDIVAPRQNHEGYELSTAEIIAAGNTTEAKKRKRRFNVWDIIRGYFKKKKRKSGGGGGTPPAPPAPPAEL